jgi:glucose-fructose oxidoreductase
MANLKKQTSSGRDSRKIRYAVIGQGYISQIAVLPAFAHAAKNSELAALVSDDPEKLRKLSKKYQVENICSYDEYDELMKSGEVDAVYLALPNNLHRDYTIRAARAGVHVLCEKPMAVTEQECEEMISACGENKVKLMIAYRLHFEEANLKAIELVKTGKIGEPRIFNSIFTNQVETGNIRLRRETGGGTLYDIGIYCINAARYLLRSEPTEVFATLANNGEPRFNQVEEMASVILRFPNNQLANFICSFGASDVSSYEIVGTEGSLRVDKAYEFADDIKHTLTIKGKSRERTFPQRDQFAPELLYFSDCILTGAEPEPSGYEGLIDVHIIRALYRSVEIGEPIKLSLPKKDQRPNLEQEIKRPAVKEPELVNAATPSGKR